MEAPKNAKKEVVKPNLHYQREKDRTPVKGKFHFHEVPHGEMSFSIKIYKEDQVENYTFKDGEIKTIPLGVAKHLNKNCWYPEYDYVRIDNDNGFQNVAKITRKIRRCSFQSLEFLDIDEMNTDTVPMEAARP
jgi:hypothetical protein